MRKKYIAVLCVAILFAVVLLAVWFMGWKSDRTDSVKRDVTVHKDVTDETDEIDKMLDMEAYFQMIADVDEGDYQETDESVVKIPYENLQLNRSNIYLKEGLQFSLRFQPDEYSKWNKVEDPYAFWNVLRKAAVWKSSNEEVATVKDGVVKAISQGEALITVRLKEFTHTCKINVMPKEEDEAIPLRFNNNFFTEELYKKVKGIEVYGIDPLFRITSKYGISYIYAMLAEYNEIKKYADEPNEKGYGMGGIILILENGEEILVGSEECIRGELSITGALAYQGKKYKCYYGPDADYGKANLWSSEIYYFGPQLRSLEKS